ncbi:hypothetical protein [Xanthomonas campestris]|uniref:hypothetical protein n=1 Tax=Xanthomonas campestris TaxID=339 RepID=UPI00137972CE
MNEKSHVSMEQRVCPVCGSPHDTGSILLDKRMRARINEKTIVGRGLCPEHQ